MSTCAIIPFVLPYQLHSCRSNGNIASFLHNRNATPREHSSAGRIYVSHCRVAETANTPSLQVPLLSSCASNVFTNPSPCLAHMFHKACLFRKLFARGKKGEWHDHARARRNTHKLQHSIAAAAAVDDDDDEERLSIALLWSAFLKSSRSLRELFSACVPCSLPCANSISGWNS